MVRGALVKLVEGEEKVVPPPYLRDAVVEEVHAALCYAGRDRVRDAVGQRFWWPGWAADVTRVLLQCLGC